MNQQIFKEIQTLKHQILPNEKVIIFGSQARGDAREGSDWDLLVLLGKDKKEQADKDKIFEFVLMGWRLGVYLSIKLYTENEWDMRKYTPFYENVVNDGIEII